MIYVIGAILAFVLGVLYIKYADGDRNVYLYDVCIILVISSLSWIAVAIWIIMFLGLFVIKNVKIDFNKKIF